VKVYVCIVGKYDETLIEKVKGSEPSAQKWKEKRHQELKQEYPDTDYVGADYLEFEVE
jgi:hypothetical protein